MPARQEILDRVESMTDGQVAFDKAQRIETIIMKPLRRAKNGGGNELVVWINNGSRRMRRRVLKGYRDLFGKPDSKSVNSRQTIAAWEKLHVPQI